MSMSRQPLTEERNPKSRNNASEKAQEVIVIHITNKPFTGSSITIRQVVRNKAGRIAREIDSGHGTDGDACHPLARWITSGKTPSTRSTSSKVDSRPSEKRTRELANCLSTPSASTTCEGSNDPAEQADPLEAQMPSKSSPASKGRLSDPSTTNETVLARRRSCEPTN